MSRNAFDKLARELEEEEELRAHARMEREIDKNQEVISHLMDRFNPVPWKYRVMAADGLSAGEKRIKELEAEVEYLNGENSIITLLNETVLARAEKAEAELSELRAQEPGPGGTLHWRLRWTRKKC